MVTRMREDPATSADSGTLYLSNVFVLEKRKGE
jgi:hypothetical protein